MKLTQSTTFASVKLYCLITLICLIILINHIAQIALIRKFIVSVQVRTFPLNTCDIIIYVARWWDKYLSKRSLIKHTCSWRDRLIVLWTLNRQAKIFLRNVYYCLVVSLWKCQYWLMFIGVIKWLVPYMKNSLAWLVISYHLWFQGI